MVRTLGMATSASDNGVSSRPLGAHMSIAGEMALAVERAAQVQANALQIFTKNQMQWTAKPLEDAVVARFRAAFQASPVRYLCAHGGYLINLASINPDTRAKARESLTDELRRAGALGCDCLVLHPGSPKEAGKEQGIAWAAEGLCRVLEATGDLKVPIALENTAGQGATLGMTFVELAEIIQAADNHPRLQLCLDTCHAFAAGYDLRRSQAVDEMAAEIDRHVGLERLRVLHLNDSLKDCGSRVDRHQHIGQGFIGDEGFRNLLGHEAFHLIPGILETPKDEKTLEQDRINLERLRRLDTT